jgi:hypothetical protein
MVYRLGEELTYCTVSVALLVVERYVPEICEVVLAVTELVVTVKVMLFRRNGHLRCLEWLSGAAF